MSRDFPGTAGNYLATSGSPSTLEFVTANGPWSIGIWAKPDVITGDTTFISKYSGSHGPLLRTSGSGVGMFVINSGNSGQEAITVADLVVGQWQLVGGAFNGSSTLRAMINGVQGASVGVTALHTNQATNWHIGARPTNSQLFNGHLYGAFFYNVYLTDAEWLALGKGASPLRIRPGSLRAYIPILGTGSPERDYSGKGATFNVTGTLPAGATNPPVAPFVMPIAGATLSSAWTGVTADSATVYVNLEATVEEEFPVVYFRLQPSTFAESFLRLFDDPMVRRSYLNPPDEDPLTEDGKWAKLDTSSTNEIKKVTEFGVGMAKSNDTGDAHVYFTEGAFGHDAEVMLQTYDADPGAVFYAWLAVQGAGTPTPSGYRLKLNYISGSGDVWTIQRVDAGVPTDLGTTTKNHWQGDWMALRRVGDLLVASQLFWTDVPNEDVPANGEWWDNIPGYEFYFEEVLSVTDSTIVSEGHVGFGTNQHGDVRNFFAGDAFSIKEDTEEVYLSLGIRGYEGIVGEPTFFGFDSEDELEVWDFYWSDNDVSIQHHTYLSEIVATGGPTSLRVKLDSVYPLSDFLMQWPDYVNGGDTSVTYWITYAFYVDSWAAVYQGGENTALFLPCFQRQTNWDNASLSGEGPTLTALSETTGQISYRGSSQTIAAGQWHTIRMSCRNSGSVNVVELWLNGTTDIYADTESSTATPPMGIAIGNDGATDAAGVVYIDELTWSPDAEPTEPTITEVGTGQSTDQWVRIRDYEGGPSLYVYLDIWEYAGDYVPDAWTYAEIFIPQSYLDTMASGEYGQQFLETDAAQFYLHKWHTGTPRPVRLEWYGVGFSQQLLVSELEGDTWYRIETHYDYPNDLLEIWVNDELHTYNITAFGYNEGTSYLSAQQPDFIPGALDTRNPDVWIGVDNLAWDDRGRVSDQQFRHYWDFEGIENLLGAQASYPTPPFDVSFGGNNYELSLEEGGFGGGPGLPIGVVYLSITPEASEVVGLSTFGTAYLELTPTGGVTYLDTPTVYVTLTPLGGECYSTFTAEQFGQGEATLRWSPLENNRWDEVEDNLRWTAAPALADTIHC